MFHRIKSETPQNKQAIEQETFEDEILEGAEEVQFESEEDTEEYSEETQFDAEETDESDEESETLYGAANDADVTPTEATETHMPEAVTPKYQTRPVSRYTMATARTTAYASLTKNSTQTTEIEEDVSMTEAQNTQEETTTNTDSMANPYARTAATARPVAGYTGTTYGARPTASYVAQPSAPQQTAQTQASRTAQAASAEKDRTLTIGAGITMSGEIESCDYLVVEGTVEAALKGARSLDVTETGVFYGTVEIEDATIAGRFEGDITAYGRLTILSTGIVTGSITYAELELEAGAVVDGRLSPVGAQTATSSAQQTTTRKTSSAKQTATAPKKTAANREVGLFDARTGAAE